MVTTENLWDKIDVGYEVPTLIKKPTYMQLFMFSAITWNRHLIHYNSDFAKKDGLPDVATHRALIGNFMAQMLTNWLGYAGKIRKLEWSVRATAVPGNTLHCQAKVVGKRLEADGKVAECDISVLNQKGDLIAPGKGVVLFY